jgi:hypothetical protein
MKQTLFLAGIFLALSAYAAAINVSVTSPGDGSQVSSPFTLSANASTNYSITGWKVYLDGQVVYSAGQTRSISTSLNASSGSHRLVTRAWDSSGAYDDMTVNITVSGGGGGGGGLPDPPPGSLVISHIEDRGGWRSCHDPGCAGGSGRGSYWMAQFQSSPSRDGSSVEFYNSGVWANALWYNHVGAHNDKRNFLLDFWFRLDDASRSAAQSLEFESFQFTGGWNYMMGSQCSFGSGWWDTWEESTGHWMHTNVPCTRFTTNTWHHVQWYITTDHSSHTYTYHTLVVDGHSYPINTTRHAKDLNWGDNSGAQWQLDVNATGQGYHMWVDQATLTMW